MTIILTKPTIIKSAKPVNITIGNFLKKDFFYWRVLKILLFNMAIL